MNITTNDTCKDGRIGVLILCNHQPTNSWWWGWRYV